MLKNLEIKNIGGIKNINIEFSKGLNVITGESGAGKSSIVRALELLTGSRRGVKFIRAGENKGVAQAEFSDGKIIKREILNTGRSNAKINNSNTGLVEFLEIVNNLIRIQSQFAQLELLDSDRQLNMLNSYMPENFKNVISEFESVFENAKAKNSELRTLKKRRSEIEKEYANAAEIFNLIKTAQPEQGLESKLENSLADLNHEILKLERANKAYDILTGGLSENGLIEKSRIEYEFLYDFIEQDSRNEIINAFDILINNLKDSVDKNFYSLENKIAQRDEIEKRLGALRRLKRLCGRSDESELINYTKDVAKNLEILEKSYADVEKLNSEAIELKKRANALAMEIRKQRHNSAELLISRVNKLLSIEKVVKAIKGVGMIMQAFEQYTDMPHEWAMSKAILITEKAYGIELTNLKSTTPPAVNVKTDELLTPTLVFDEVEAGLGGKAAVLAGMQLKKLSNRCQVILITHEASIAALGDVHFLIKRENKNEQSENNSSVKKITERVKELARMLSGSPELTEAQEHARILLEQSVILIQV